MKIRNGLTARTLLAMLLSIVLAISVTGSAGANLSESHFESGDGDLDPSPSDTTTFFDWNHPWETISCPGTNCALDPVGSDQDDVLDPATREVDAVPTILYSSVPSDRDDLRRFYVNHEVGESNEYLHLAWERVNLSSAAYMDFELNQSITPGANGVTPSRTEGDVLLSFHFGGTGSPIIFRRIWMTSGDPALVCGATSTSLPCWSKGVRLRAAEASVNHAPVVDTNAPDAPFTLPSDITSKGSIRSTFGEMGILMADIFPQDRCVTFSSIWLKSRSSAGLNSGLNDFIAPVLIDIRNCGYVAAYKSDLEGNSLPGAVLTLYVDNPPLYPAELGPEDVATDMSCTSDESGYCDIRPVPLGHYWLVETQAPEGYVLGFNWPVWFRFGELGLSANIDIYNTRE